MEKQKGQALITLLFFTVLGITLISTAVAVVTINSLAASKLDQGINAYYIAESGAENAYIRLIRNPAYTGESLPVGSGTAVITVTGTSPYVIQSKGNVGNFTRTVEVDLTYSSGKYTVIKWTEI